MYDLSNFGKLSNGRRHDDRYRLRAPAVFAKPRSPTINATPTVTSKMSRLSVLALAEITVRRDEDKTRNKVSIGEVKELGSYRMVRPAAVTAFIEDRRAEKLVNADIDNIVVLTPGIPDVYHAERIVKKIQNDAATGAFVSVPDTHGAILVPMGLSMHEPAIRCLADPTVLDDVDVVLNRNSLRKIYRMMLDPKDVSFDDKANAAFRIDAELIEGMVFLHRWEPTERRQIGRPHPGQSGMSYHQAVCSEIPETKDSMGTARIIKYRLGDLVVAVRFDVDATTEEALPSLDALSLSSATQSTSSESVGSKITIKRVPLEDVSHDSLLEIKSRAAYRELDLIELYGQLVFSQTKRLIIARHVKGDYSRAERVEYKLGEGELAEIAERQEPALAGVAKVLGEMVAATKKHGDVSFVGEQGRIRVHRRREKLDGLTEEAMAVLKKAKSSRLSFEGTARAGLRQG